MVVATPSCSDDDSNDEPEKWNNQNPTTQTIDGVTVSGTVGDYTYVDLGLSVKWATCNVGATKPTEYGDYFAWGETKPKEEYTQQTYKLCRNISRDRYGEPNDFTKYVTTKERGIVDNKTVLDAADDAATANWGNAWRMPTHKEIKELIKGCNWQSTSDYNGTGVAGRIGTSKTNGNTIFLPGYPSSMGFKGYSGYYWSSSLSDNDSGYAYQISLNEFNIFDFGARRSNKGKVRAVAK